MSPTFLTCPRCGSTRFYAVSSTQKMSFFHVDQNLRPVVTATGSADPSQIDLSQIYCTGCSWSGAATQLTGNTSLRS
jgi:hypothetical protein